MIRQGPYTNIDDGIGGGLLPQVEWIFLFFSLLLILLEGGGRKEEGGGRRNGLLEISLCLRLPGPEFIAVRWVFCFEKERPIRIACTFFWLKKRGCKAEEKSPGKGKRRRRSNNKACTIMNVQ